MRQPTAIVLALIVAAACGESRRDPFEVPDSPDGTVRVVMSALAEQRPEVVWRALPPSYQSDVEGLAASFAESMDPVLFDRAVAVARKGVVVLQSKKELILSTDTVRGSGVDVAKVDAAWESAVHIADEVLASDLARLDAYPALDIDRWLATTGRAVMGHAADLSASDLGAEGLAARLADLGRTEVSMVSRDGERAVVRIAPPDREPIELAMERVEGRWLPSDLVQRWPEMIDRTRDRIAHLGSEDAAQLRMQALFGVGIVEGFIDRIAEMESADELDSLVGGWLGPLIRRGSPPTTPAG